MIAASLFPADPFDPVCAGHHRRWFRGGLGRAVVLIALLAPGLACALTFGRLSVQSSVGEPLKAEVQIAAVTPEEASSLTLRLAPAQAYRAAGIEFDAVLEGARVERLLQADGQWVIQISTQRPVRNVFLDLLLEARWASGQRVLGYTLLVGPAAARPPAASDEQEPTPVALAATSGRPAAPSGAAPTPSSAAASPGAHVVQPGDTLLKVARQHRVEGVSLEQMLVALYRSNPQAFMAGNMNRLKAGAVLTLPSPSQAAAQGSEESSELIRAQSADFAAYKARLAGAVPQAAAGQSPSRQASGKVEARVQDSKAASAPTPDQLKLSQAGVKAASSPEATLSRNAAAREAAQREAELARNLEALRQLQQKGDKGTSSSQGPAAASAPVAASGVVSSLPASVASAPAAAASAAVPVGDSASAPAPVAAPGSAASAASSPAVPASDPASGPAVGSARLQDMLRDSPYSLPAAAGLVLMLAGLGAYRLVRSRRAGDALETSFQASRFEGPSMGAGPETRIGLGSIEGRTQGSLGLNDLDGQALSELGGVGDVDPVAEADVYLAYGRDQQAEEILREAMRATPERLDVQVKLLEVLALRRESGPFEAVARITHSATGAEGPQWAQVASMGRNLDPDNPLYASSLPDFDAVGEGLDDVTPPAPVPGAQSAGVAEVQDGPSADLEPATDVGPALGPVPQAVEASDFSLDLGEDQATASTPAAQASVEAPSAAPEVDLAAVDLTDEEDLRGLQFDEAPLEDPLERKLALAQEFLQIGDLDAARDLLDEVILQSEGAMQDRARQLLDTLG